MNLIKFSEVLLLTSESTNVIPGINVSKIAPLQSLDDYSDFLIYELHRHIKTKHCLIIQWDGFVINPRMWSNEYLEYDYIGSPFKMRNNDYWYSKNREGVFYSVGNGGFSLRSKDLLAAPTRLGLKRPDWVRSNNEDGFFCVEQRNVLEQNGFKWAPQYLASKFGNECGILDKKFLKHSFGFHGYRLYQRHKYIGGILGNGY